MRSAEGDCTESGTCKWSSYEVDITRTATGTWESEESGSTRVKVLLSFAVMR
jgi:hypothetical protein